jgi:hypothetical protein
MSKLSLCRGVKAASERVTVESMLDVQKQQTVMTLSEAPCMLRNKLEDVVALTFLRATYLPSELQMFSTSRHTTCFNR